MGQDLSEIYRQGRGSTKCKVKPTAGKRCKQYLLDMAGNYRRNSRDSFLKSWLFHSEL